MGEEGKRRMLGIFVRGMLEGRVRVRVSKGQWGPGIGLRDAFGRSRHEQGTIVICFR